MVQPNATISSQRTIAETLCETGALVRLSRHCAGQAAPERYNQFFEGRTHSFQLCSEQVPPPFCLINTGTSLLHRQVQGAQPLSYSYCGNTVYTCSAGRPSYSNKVLHHCTTVSLHGCIVA